MRTTSFSESGGFQQGWGATLSGSEQVVCLADIDRNGIVDGLDLAYLLGAWNNVGEDLPADINADGTIDGIDLALLLGSWGDCNSESLED